MILKVAPGTQYKHTCYISDTRIMPILINSMGKTAPTCLHAGSRRPFEASGPPTTRPKNHVIT